MPRKRDDGPAVRAASPTAALANIATTTRQGGLSVQPQSSPSTAGQADMRYANRTDATDPPAAGRRGAVYSATWNERDSTAGICGEHPTSDEPGRC